MLLSDNQRCMPVHDGPFFFESEQVRRCGGCNQMVTIEQVRLAAKHAAIAGDGNAIQSEQSRKRVEGGER